MDEKAQIRVSLSPPAWSFGVVDFPVLGWVVEDESVLVLKNSNEFRVLAINDFKCVNWWFALIHQHSHTY